MRDLTFITKKPLELEKCLEQIKTIFKGAKGNGHNIYIGKSLKSLYIWFPSIKKYDPSEYWDEEELKNLPEDFKYFTSVEFHLTSVSKQVVKALESLYPEMIVEDENGNFYSITKYLDTTFEY